MKVIYDRATDTLTLIFREGEVAESDELRPGVIVDYDSQGRLISVEVLDASEHVAEPASIGYEVKGVVGS